MMELESATLGGGCFWCLEAPFQLIDGIESITSGYAGGHTSNPSYREVTSGVTGHAEVVQLKYDPEKISFEKILEIFFSVHDPTTMNRQGADVGTQYRSVIIAHNDEQQKLAVKAIDSLEKANVFDGPIVTQVVQHEAFYPAEAYHQNYYKSNPTQPYCSFVIKPKVEKVQRIFAANLAS